MVKVPVVGGLVKYIVPVKSKVLVELQAPILTKILSKLQGLQGGGLVKGVVTGQVVSPENIAVTSQGSPSGVSVFRL